MIKRKENTVTGNRKRKKKQRKAKGNIKRKEREKKHKRNSNCVYVGHVRVVYVLPAKVTVNLLQLSLHFYVSKT